MSFNQNIDTTANPDELEIHTTFLSEKNCFKIPIDRAQGNILSHGALMNLRVV